MEHSSTSLIASVFDLPNSAVTTNANSESKITDSPKREGSQSPNLSQRIRADSKKGLQSLISNIVKLEQTRRKDSMQYSEPSNSQASSRKSSEMVFFDMQYERIEKLGEGGNSCVYTCRKIDEEQTGGSNSSNSRVYAVKITKSNEEEFIRNESDSCNRLIRLNHPNICKAYDYIVEKSINTTYLIMELVPGKNLEQLVETRKSLIESDIRLIMKGILEGIAYLHDEGFIHRDITTSNVMFDSKLKRVKILDLSTCKQNLFLTSRRRLLTQTGNDLFRAPETFDSTYSREVDVWGAGIIFYILLFSKHPFYHDEDDSVALIRKITSQEVPWSDLFQTHPQYEIALDLCAQMLQKRPSDRITAKGALSHPFLKKRLSSLDFSYSKYNDINSIRNILRTKSCENLSNYSTEKEEWSHCLKRLSSKEEPISPSKRYQL